MSNQLTTSPEDNSLKGLLSKENIKQQIARALPKHLSADRFLRVAMTALLKTPKLAECSQASFMKALLDLSSVGLEPDGRRAHLIPYGKDVTLIIDYKGLVELIRRDENVIDVQCYTIRANDTVLWKNGVISHEFNPLNDRGEVKAVYTMIQWKSGHTSFGEPFTKADAELAKRSSKAASNGPWVTHYTAMWKKSAIRNDSKMWPLTPEIREAIEKDDDLIEGFRDVTPAKSAPVPVLKPITQAVIEDTPEAPLAGQDWDGDNQGFEPEELGKEGK